MTHLEGKGSQRELRNEGLSTGSDLIDATLYSGIQRPVEGLVQIAGKVSEQLGGSYFEAPHWIAKPEEREAWSGAWCMQQVGNIAGTVPWILGVNKGIRCLSGGSLARFAGTANSLSLGRAALVGTELGVTGATYETLFRPVDADNFAFEKFRNAGTSFTAYGVMGGTASLMSGIAPAVTRTVGESFAGRLAGRTANGVVGFGAGASGGMMHSLTEDVIENRTPSFERMKQRGVEYGGIGAVLGLAGRPDMRVTNSRGKFERRSGVEEREMEPIGTKTPREAVMAGQHWQRAQELSSRGDYREAMTEMMEAIKLRKKAYGADHPMVADNLVDAASLNYRRGPDFYAEAQQQLQEAIAIRRGAYGTQNSEVANTHVQSSGLYKAQGDYARAAEQLQESVNIWSAMKERGALPVSLSPAALVERMRELAGLYRMASMPEKAAAIDKGLQGR